MDFLKDNWQWISENPWGFIATALACAGAGWGAARIFYAERIELLKTRAEHRPAAQPAVAAQAFVYEPQGRHGSNVLANSTREARVGQPQSFQAVVPPNSRLHVALSGPPPQSLSDAAAAWSYSIVGVVNWTPGEYEESTSTPSQHFNAMTGNADLKLTFWRPGAVTIQAYEGDSQTPTWTKRLMVRA